MINFKRNDDGSIILNKGAIALGMLLIALVSCIATVVAYGVSMKSDIDYLKTHYEEAGPKHTAIIEKIEDNVNDNSESIVLNTERITTMQSDIKEIKSDIKKLLEQTK